MDVLVEWRASVADAGGCRLTSSRSKVHASLQRTTSFDHPSPIPTWLAARRNAGARTAP